MEATFRAGSGELYAVQGLAGASREVQFARDRLDRELAVKPAPYMAGVAAAATELTKAAWALDVWTDAVRAAWEDGVHKEGSLGRLLIMAGRGTLWEPFYAMKHGHNTFTLELEEA